jgi:galactoside O-acetyltransferase
VHVAVYTSLIGRGRIEVHDFANLSSRVSIYSSNDDYSGRTMTNPMVPEEFTGVTHADVIVGRHVIVGSGSIVLPGVVLEEGVAVGALSLVRDSCSAFGIYAGMPAKRVGERSRQLLEPNGNCAPARARDFRDAPAEQHGGQHRRNGSRGCSGRALGAADLSMAGA